MNKKKPLRFFAGCLAGFFLMGMLPVFVTASASSESNSSQFPDIELYGGVSRLSGAKWGSWMFMGDKYISFEADPVSITKVEGALCETKLGITLGVNMELDDNLVGKIARSASYIGIKNIYLRYQTGALAGTASWKVAPLAPGQVFPYRFNEEYTHIDALWWFKKFLGGFMPGYVGLGYTRMAIPAEVRTLKTDTDLTRQKYAIPFFEPRHTGRYYSFLFGFDTFSSSMLYLAKDNSLQSRMSSGDIGSGFGIFFTAADRIGFGESNLSEEGMAAARALNPGLEPVTDRFFGAYLENESSIGLRWKGNVGRFYLSVGAGYELAFFSITNFGGAAEKKGDLGFATSPNIIRYGPVFRLYTRW